MFDKVLNIYGLIEMVVYMYVDDFTSYSLYSYINFIVAPYQFTGLLRDSLQNILNRSIGVF